MTNNMAVITVSYECTLNTSRRHQQIIMSSRSTGLEGPRSAHLAPPYLLLWHDPS
jgi:hypothetical protein